MARPLRIAVIGVALSLLALELGYRAWRGPRVPVVVQNRSGGAIRGVTLRADGAPTTAGGLGDRADATLAVAAFGPSPLTLTYRDEDGRSQALEIAAFEGPRLYTEGLRFAVVVQPDGFLTIYNEDDPSAYARLKQALWLRTSATLPFPF